MAIKITITAQLKREPEQLIQTFILTEDKPLKFKPEILKKMMSCEISLVTEGKSNE